MYNSPNMPSPSSSISSLNTYTCVFADRSSNWHSVLQLCLSAHAVAAREGSGFGWTVAVDYNPTSFFGPQQAAHVLGRQNITARHHLHDARQRLQLLLHHQVKTVRPLATAPSLPRFLALCPTPPRFRAPGGINTSRPPLSRRAPDFQC